MLNWTTQTPQVANFFAIIKKTLRNLSYIYMCVYTYICIHIHIYVCMYVCIYTALGAFLIVSFDLIPESGTHQWNSLSVFKAFHSYYRISLQKELYQLTIPSSDEWSLTNMGGSGVGKMVLLLVHIHGTWKSVCFPGTTADIITTLLALIRWSSTPSISDGAGVLRVHRNAAFEAICG